jgi:MbtH protein
MADEQDDKRAYIVLTNAEGQYSLWLKEKSVPAGWQYADKEGSKSDCVAHVDSIWTDMRPISLRQKMTGE